LALFALFLRPGNRLPVRRQQQACTGIGHFDPITAGLVDIEKEGLLDRVLVWPGLDVDAVFQKDIGRFQHILAAIERVGDVVEATFDAMRFARVGEIVALVRAGEPHAGFRAVIEHDAFGETKAQIALEELAVGLHVDGEAVEVVEATYVDPTCREALRLIFKRRSQGWRRLVPLGLVVKLNQVPVGIVKLIGGPVSQFALVPSHPIAGARKRFDAPLQRLRAAGAEGHMAKARGGGAGQLQRVALIVVPGPEVNRGTLPAALGHAEHVHEEAQTFLRFGGEHLKMGEMGHVHDRFIVHDVVSRLRELDLD